MKRSLLVATIMGILAALTASADADIYQWTYDSTGASLNQDDATPRTAAIHESSHVPEHLCMNGAGLSPADGSVYSSPNLNYGYLPGAIYANSYLFSTVFADAYLPGANFGNSNLGWADFTRASLPGANLSGCDARFGIFTGADVSGVNFTNVKIAEGLFDDANFTLAQLTSTASYLSGYKDVNSTVVDENGDHALSNVNLSGLNLSGGELSERFLENAYFQRTNLSGASLSKSDLWGGSLADANLKGANLTGALLDSTVVSSATDFTLADLRGAVGWIEGHTLFSLTTGIARNTILADGKLNNLALLSGDTLVVRNHTTAIHAVGSTAGMAAGSTVQILYDGHGWGSTISFDSGATVNLAGTLQLSLAPDVNISSLVGTTSLTLFDWTGVTRSGALGTSGISPIWDLSHLYTTGMVTLTVMAGDANLDGIVNINDLSKVLTNYDRTSTSWGDGDFNGDGTVNINDLSNVLTNYDRSVGATARIMAVPEPSTTALLFAAAASLLTFVRRKRQ